VKIGTERCPACGEASHGDAPCAARTDATDAALATGAAGAGLAASGTSAPGTTSSAPCRCLPEPLDGWRACASCGLPQAPDKEWCGFCGHRWRSDEAWQVDGVPPS
jgi:hypothetical protein